MLRRWSTFLFNSWRRKSLKICAVHVANFHSWTSAVEWKFASMNRENPPPSIGTEKVKVGFAEFPPGRGKTFESRRGAFYSRRLTKFEVTWEGENVGKLEQIESFPQNMGTLGTKTSCWREHIYGLLLKCMALNENDVWKCCPCQANVSLPVWVWVWKENRWLRNCKQKKSLRWKDAAVHIKSFCTIYAIKIYEVHHGIRTYDTLIR